MPIIHAANPGRDLNATRKHDLQAGLNLLNAGGPPLLGKGSPLFADLDPRFGQSGGYYPLGMADDKGLYLAVPLVGHLLGAHDALEVYRWLFAAVFAITLLVYPLIFDALCGSLIVALGAPLALLVLTVQQAPEDVEIIAVWAIYALVPLLLLLARRWTHRTPWALLGITVLAGLATCMRSGAGLPVLVSGLLLLLLERKRLQAIRGFALAAAMIVLYLAPNWGISALWSRERTHIANPYLRSQVIVNHPVWHSLVIGLSFPGNHYGVPRYEDQFAYALARARDPSVVIFSPHYEALLRGVYFKIVQSHPGFVAVGYIKRAIIVLSYLQIFWFGLLFLPCMLLLGDRCGQTRRYLALLGPVAALSLFGPAVLVSQGYDDPIKATATLIGLLAAGWLVVNRRQCLGLLRAAWPPRPLSPAAWSHSLRSLDSGYRRAALLTAGVIVAVLVVTIAGTHFQAQYM